MDPQIIAQLKNGRMGILATDTIYGLVGSALIPEAVERIYQIRQRDLSKPFIILISSLDDLNKYFGLHLKGVKLNLLKKIWPNQISIILPCSDEKFTYLHRGQKSLAFRMPNKPGLLELLKQTGPLVAPSANLEGQPEASTIEEAKNYFGSKVDFYLDEGKIANQSSTLISLENDQIKILRQGLYQLPVDLEC
jgi:L-threonylcarbamoyladenylate synthase